jgi:aryl-phospho-beta-D-glucosidase BglC (GH1 family)
MLEVHWDTWVKDEDWAWLVERGINSVRIPVRMLRVVLKVRSAVLTYSLYTLQIGYYHLCGADPSVVKNTAFEDFGYVFAGAWARITRAIETANEHGIGVLLGLF